MGFLYLNRWNYGERYIRMLCGVQFTRSGINVWSVLLGRLVNLRSIVKVSERLNSWLIIRFQFSCEEKITKACRMPQESQHCSILQLIRFTLSFDSRNLLQFEVSTRPDSAYTSSRYSKMHLYSSNVAMMIQSRSSELVPCHLMAVFINFVKSHLPSMCSFRASNHNHARFSQCF